MNESGKFTQHRTTNHRLIPRDYLGVLGVSEGLRVITQI